MLVESVRDYAIVILSIEGFVVSWNRGAERIQGYRSQEIIGRHVSTFYTEEDLADNAVELHLQKAASRGRFETEAWRVRKDGSMFWAHDVLTALTDDSGRLVGFGKVTRDLTRRRNAEKEIRHLNESLSEQLQKTRTEVFDYKHALDESAIVAITNQKGIITHVNENFCRISKYSKEELLGQDHRIINSGFHPKAFIRDLWVTIAKGRIWRGELKNRAKDGSYYWVDTTIVPFLNEKQKPYQYLAIRSDITSRKNIEEQLYRVNEALEHKVKERTYELTEALEREKELGDLKSRFVSMASHEFRTPLSAILSSIALVEHYTENEQAGKRQKHIERIRSSVKNLASILEDFLSLERMEEGKVEVHNIHFNLRELVVDVIEEMDGMRRRKGQHISLQYSGALHVVQDKKILHNVLLNLLSNAIKYSPEEARINLDARVKNGAVELCVEDEGIGIPEEAQQHLFSKFFRAGNAVNFQGTGLGLHIVKRYMELLNGTIAYESEEGVGSTFTIRFPSGNNS